MWLPSRRGWRIRYWHLIKRRAIWSTISGNWKVISCPSKIKSQSLIFSASSMSLYKRPKMKRRLGLNNWRNTNSRFMRKAFLWRRYLPLLSKIRLLQKSQKLKKLKKSTLPNRSLKIRQLLLKTKSRLIIFLLGNLLVTSKTVFWTLRVSKVWKRKPLKLKKFHFKHKKKLKKSFKPLMKK